MSVIRSKTEQQSLQIATRVDKCWCHSRVFTKNLAVTAVPLLLAGGALLALHLHAPIISPFLAGHHWTFIALGSLGGSGLALSLATTAVARFFHKKKVEEAKAEYQEKHTKSDLEERSYLPDYNGDLKEISPQNIDAQFTKITPPDVDTSAETMIETHQIESESFFVGKTKKDNPSFARLYHLQNTQLPAIDLYISASKPKDISQVVGAFGKAYHQKYEEALNQEHDRLKSTSPSDCFQAGLQWIGSCLGLETVSRPTSIDNSKALLKPALATALNSAGGEGEQIIIMKQGEEYTLATHGEVTLFRTDHDTQASFKNLNGTTVTPIHKDLEGTLLFGKTSEINDYKDTISSALSENPQEIVKRCCTKGATKLTLTSFFHTSSLEV